MANGAHKTIAQGTKQMVMINVAKKKTAGSERGRETEMERCYRPADRQIRNNKVKGAISCNHNILSSLGTDAFSYNNNCNSNNKNNNCNAHSINFN